MLVLIGFCVVGVLHVKGLVLTAVGASLNRFSCRVAPLRFGHKFAE